MPKLTVHFDLDELAGRLTDAIDKADDEEADDVVISRATWVMARSLVDEHRRLVEVGWQTGNSVVLHHDTPIATRALYARGER